MNFLNPVILSLKLSFVTTLFLFVLGLPFAFWLANSKSRFKPVIESIVALPIVLPPTVLGFYLLMLLGSRGVVGQFFSEYFDMQLAFTFTGLVIGSFFYSFPFAVQPMQTAFESVDKRLIEASWTMGHSKWKTFWKIIIPLSKSGLVTGGVLSFAHTMGEFGVVLMIGGSIPGVSRVASIAIYDEVQKMNYEGANILALILLAISFTVLLLTYYLNKRIVRAV